MSNRKAFSLLSESDFKGSSEKAAALILIEKYDLLVFPKTSGHYKVTHPESKTVVHGKSLVDCVCNAVIKILEMES